MFASDTKIDQVFLQTIQALRNSQWVKEPDKLAENLSVHFPNAMTMRVHCDEPTGELAAEAYEIAEETLKNQQIAGFQIEIFWGKTLYGTAPTASLWKAKNFSSGGNKSMIQAIGGKSLDWGLQLSGSQVIDLMGENTIYLHSANRDAGYPILEVHPSQSALRLNRPKELLIGKSINVLDTAIAGPRIDGIEEAIEQRTIVKRPYQYTWSGVLWQFCNWIMPIDGDRIAVVVVDTEDWQKQFWKHAVA